EVNRGWILAANLASDLDAWVRLLALHDIDGLAGAEPDTMRFRLYHLPARLADHARRRRTRKEKNRQDSGLVEPGAPAASRDGPPPTA
ncbi:hypothetical protein ACWD0J_29300, partial [Streptomyces sp. NPDC003011]